MVATTPAWIARLERVQVLDFDPDIGELVLGLAGRRAAIAFGVVPSGTHVIVKTQHFHNHSSIKIELESQEAGVHWDFALGAHTSIELPQTMQSLSIRGSGQPSGPSRIIWHRSGGKLTLSGGAFAVDVGDMGEGLYRVDHVGDDKSPLTLTGKAKCERLTGTSEGTATIANPAPNLQLVDHAGKVVVSGKCDGLSSRGTPELECTAPVTGTVQIEASNVAFTSVQSAGTIKATTIAASMGMAGIDQGRLECVVTRSFWCREGTAHLDIRLVRESAAMPLALIGTNAPQDRLVVEEAAVHDPRLLVPATVTATSAFPDATVVDTTFTGGGDLELACPASGVTIGELGGLRTSSSLTLSLATEGAPRTSIRSAFAGGLLDLGKSSILVEDRLHANAIIDGAVLTRGEDPGLVVATNRVADASVDAQVVRITGRDVQLAAERSTIRAHHHLHVSGPIDAESTVSAFGDASFTGAVDCADGLRWSPMPWSAAVTKNSLHLYEKVTKVVVEPTSTALARAEIVTSDGTHIAQLATSRDLTISTLEDESAWIDVLRIAGTPTVTFGSGVSRIPSVLCDGDATLVLGDDDAARTEVCSLGLGSPGTHVSVTLDSGTRALEIGRASSDDRTLNASSPNLTLRAGYFVVATLVDQVRALRTVELDVAGTGRINVFEGTFKTRRIEGRIQGGDGTHNGSAKLESWPPGFLGLRTEPEPTASEVEDGVRGQLIDVDISGLNASDVTSLTRLEVLSPAARPLVNRALSLGPRGHSWLKAYRGVLRRPHEPVVNDDIRAEAQRLREIADAVRARSVSGQTFSAAQWAAAHAHALQVKWLSGERFLRWLHRWVGYGVRPIPALVTYAVWVGAVTLGLYFWDNSCDPTGADFRCNAAGEYSFWDNLWRAILLPGGVLRTDIGGATPYPPAGGHPMLHFALVLITGVIIGFVVVATKNYLLRSRTES